MSDGPTKKLGLTVNLTVLAEMSEAQVQRTCKALATYAADLMFVRQALVEPAEKVSPVSYAPCITGKVEIEGAVSEFMLPLDNDSVGFSQWGAPNEVLWGRVELLDNLSGPAREWYADNRPDEESAEDDDVLDVLIGYSALLPDKHEEEEGK